MRRLFLNYSASITVIGITGAQRLVSGDVGRHVDWAGEVHHAADRKWVWKIEITCLLQARPCCRPRRQVPTRRMPDDRDSAEIELVLTRDGADVIDSPPHIEVRARPPAAGLPEPPVF